MLGLRLGNLGRGELYFLDVNEVPLTSTLLIIMTVYGIIRSWMTMTFPITRRALVATW